MFEPLAGVARAEAGVAREYLVPCRRRTDAQVVAETARRIVAIVGRFAPAQHHGVAVVCSCGGRGRVGSPVAVELASEVVVDDTQGDGDGTTGAAGGDQIEVAVIIDIGQGHRAEFEALQQGNRVLCKGGFGAKAVEGIFVDLQNGLAEAGAAVVAADDQVEVAVVVVIAPGQVAALDTGEGTVGERGEAAIAIVDPKISAQTGGGDTGRREVGIAVAIVVAPGQVGRFETGQFELCVGELA
ncbi:hypothetical protein MK163_00010 [bacterium]|nr:hypothetical protein [bacterium]